MTQLRQLSLSRLSRHLSPASFQDEEKTRVARLQHTILLAVIISTLFLLIALPLFAPSTDARMDYIRPLPLFCLALMFFSRKGYLRPVSFLLSLFIWGAVTWSSFSGGGLRAPGISGYVIAVIVPAFLLGSRSGAMFAVLNVLTGMALFLAETHGMLPSVLVYPPLGAWLAFSVISLFAAFILILADHSIQKALGRARLSEKTLAERNRQLEKQAADLRRALRAYRVLSSTNQAVLRARDEMALLHDVCHILTVTGGYLSAWIGYAQNDAEKSILPVAFGGSEAGFRNTPRLTWGDGELGKGPTGTAIRAGKPCIIQHVQDAPYFYPWRVDLTNLGYAAVIGLPLSVDGRVLGALTLFAAEPDAFDVAEVNLLQEMAGDLAYGISYLRLCSDRQAKEVALRESEALYRTLFDNAPLGLGLADADGRIVAYNRAMLQVGNFTPEDLGERPLVSDLYYRREQRAEVMSLALQQGFVDQAEVQFRRKDGTPYDVLLSLRPVNIQGQTHWQAMVEDITERNQAALERARLLRETRQRAAELALLLESATAVSSALELEEVLHLIARHLVTAAGVQGCTLSHWDREGDAVVTWIEHRRQGNGFAEAPGAAYSLRNYPATRQVLETGKPMTICAGDPAADPAETGLLRKHGRMSLLMIPMRMGDEVLGLIELDDGPGEREFTEKEMHLCQALANQAAIAIQNARLLQAKTEQSRQLNHVLGSVSEGIILLDGEHRVQMANPAGQRYLAQLTGPETNGKLRQLAGRSLDALLAAADGQRQRHELILGKEQQTFELVTTPTSGCPGQNSWVLLLREITEEKKQQQYLQAQERLATVGQLAAGVAHDFNNILAVILLYSELALREGELSTKNQERMTTVWQQAQQAAQLIAQILDYSRRSVMERSLFEPVSFVEQVLQLMQRTLPENIVLNFQHDSDRQRYLIEGDATLLQQVLLNLAVNARDAMPDGGELSVCLEGLELKGTQKPPLPMMLPGRWLNIAISDTGVGIPPEHLPHVFEPFFTTKPAGQGTGLGLAQAHGIISQHNGLIDVASQVGRGTTFTIYLPVLVLEGTSPLDPDKAKEPSVHGRGETILVVEDEEATREAVREALELLGYRPLEAANGEEALLAIEHHQGQVDLVLSDLVMPGMGGEQLLHHVRQRHPEMKMVMMTGYPLEQNGKSFLEQGHVTWLAKPFSADDVAGIIRQALEE